MAPSVKQQWQFAQRVERELQAKLKESEPLYEDIEQLIHQLRIACETSIFLDFDYATAQKVEAHLWDAHSLINNRYRKIVSRYNTPERKKQVVEKRKWEKRYVDFLKTSQFFYKGYIQRLASHYAGLSELRKIAHRLQLSTLCADTRVHVSEETEHRILLSCHATLLRLGDLSRYRNVLRTQDKSWDVAMAYYGLANDLYPKSGNAFNQMAVISLLDGEHLNAIYHLYRALAIEEPHPVAEGNLAIEFKKITKEWASGGKKLVYDGTNTATSMGNAAPLVSWFVRLHAKLYKGEEFPGHEELENEVLGQMTVLLKEQSLEGLLEKFVLINIAAEYFAAERLQASSGDGVPAAERFRSYYFFLRLNIRMLFTFLQLLQPELAGPRGGYDLPDVTNPSKDSSTDSITAVTRRILPTLRQYSTWLVSSTEIISSQKDNPLLNVHIKEMWSTYCSTLSLLVVAFPPENLSEIEYLLEEDAATVGMKPFRDSERCKLYTTEEGELKPRSSDPGIERSHPNLEMLARVRDLLRDGMVLATAQNNEGEKIAPVHLVDVKFYFVEEGLPLSPVNGLSSSQAMSSPEIPQETDTMRISDESYVQGNQITRPASVARSDSHQSMSTDMYRMVDDLVTPNRGQRNRSPQSCNESSYGMHSLTVAEVLVPLDGDGRPVSRHQASPAPFPRLPGIYNSPFSPQPGELSTTNPDRPSTAGRLLSLQLSTPQQQVAAAATLDQTTGHNSSHRMTWTTPSLPPSLPKPKQQQNASQLLQQSLTQQYNAPSSTVFSHPSSLYSGTPMRDHNSRQPYGNKSHDVSTTYGGASDFEHAALLQSSIWNGSQKGWSGPDQTPPNGQG